MISSWGEFGRVGVVWHFLAVVGDKIPYLFCFKYLSPCLSSAVFYDVFSKALVVKQDHMLGFP